MRESGVNIGERYRQASKAYRMHEQFPKLRYEEQEA